MIIRKITRRIPVNPSRKTIWAFFFGLLIILLLIGSVFGVRFYLQCRKIVEAHLKSQKWALPSTIYADAPMIYEGMLMKSKALEQYLQRLAYQQTEDITPRMGQYSRDQDSVAFFKHSFYENQVGNHPVRVEFEGGRISRIINLLDKEEIPAYELEPQPISNLFGSEWEKRTLVRYKDLPPHLVQAVLAIEDRRFFRHSGVDVKAIIRAIVNDIFHRKQLQGGSTITQQLVKNFYLTPERSVRRKISEAVMAWIMESKQSKEQILELYLNEIYLGQRGGMSINGVGEASKLFFRKDVQHISTPESALLAGMIQAPNSYNPYRHAEQARARRNTVLNAMVRTGALTSKEAETFSAAKLEVFPFDTRINLAPYFGDVVKTQLSEKYPAELIYTKNLHIFTTLDLDMQQYAEEALRSGLDSIDAARFKKVNKKVEGCLIAIEPQTGYIRAFVGGRSYSHSQFDRISQASRQPGSVFKPVVYASAVEASFGRQETVFTPATLIDDAPWSLRYSNKLWEPKNYDGRYHGIVTLREALSQSMNVATAKLAQQVGFKQVAQLGSTLGFGNVKPYPSIALGAFEVSPWQVAAAYTVFANGGVKTELRTVKKLVDSDGKMLERSQIEVKQILHPQTAYIITDMLKSVLNTGTGAAVKRWGFTRPAAGKTGTTDEYRDAWFVGYTPNLLCVVWTGYDDNTPIKMTGAQAALPIWVQFMKKATENMPPEDFSSPQGVVVRIIDPATGALATDHCPSGSPELFIQGTEPVQACTQHDSHWWNIF